MLIPVSLQKGVSGHAELHGITVCLLIFKALAVAMAFYTSARIVVWLIVLFGSKVEPVGFVLFRVVLGLLRFILPCTSPGVEGILIVLCSISCIFA